MTESKGPFEAREADAIRSRVGEKVKNRCLKEFIVRLVSDSLAPEGINGSDITADFKWNYTGEEGRFRLTVSILVKGSVWQTTRYEARVE